MKVLYEQRIKLTPAVMDSRTPRSCPVRPRTPGVHVQAINKSLGIAAGKLSNLEDSSGESVFERFSSESYPLLAALGVAWEELRASMYPEDELVWQPCEFERDQVYGTPDGLLPELGALWECKLTTKKLQPVQDLWMYNRQGMSYCAMSGMNQVLFDICFLLGDYSRPYQPYGITALVEYSRAEIEMWWSHVLRAKSNVTPEGEIVPRVVQEVEW